MGSEQKGGALRAEVDTSAPFQSVMEAVTRFGGIGFWKPHPHHPFQPSQTNIEEGFNAAKVEDEATQLHNDSATEERDALEILKEIEATTTRFEELKLKLQKNMPDEGNKTGKIQVESSKNEILKRVEEATQQVKHCTRVLEQALSRLEARRKSTEFKNSSRSNPHTPMSIGQILNRKLVLAE